MHLHVKNRSVCDFITEASASESGKRIEMVKSVFMKENLHKAEPLRKIYLFFQNVITYFRIYILLNGGNNNQVMVSFVFFLFFHHLGRIIAENQIKLGFCVLVSEYGTSSHVGQTKF